MLILGLNHLLNIAKTFQNPSGTRHLRLVRSAEIARLANRAWDFSLNSDDFSLNGEQKL